MYDLFYKHPEAEGMTYRQHVTRALWLSGQMAYGSICLLVHGLVPAWFEKTGSGVIRGLYAEIDGKTMEEHATTKKVQ